MEHGFVIDVRSSPLKVVRPSGNSTTTGTAVVNPSDTQIAPSGDGVILNGHGGSMSAPGLLLVPYGEGSATNTFLMAAFAVDPIFANDPTAHITTWTYWLLASFTCTLSAGSTGMVPISGALNYSATTFYCDTIAVLAGNANVSCEAVSPTVSVKASAVVDTKGARFIDVRFWRNGSASSANSLWRLL